MNCLSANRGRRGSGGRPVGTMSAVARLQATMSLGAPAPSALTLHGARQQHYGDQQQGEVPHIGVSSSNGWLPGTPPAQPP